MMKKTILGGLWTTTLLALCYGVVFAQSIPSIGGSVNTVTIAQPYTQAQCVEPNGSVQYITKHFYFGDSYTTRDLAPKLGGGWDQLLLTNSRVLFYNPSLFNFTSPIQWKSNGVPGNAPVNYVLALQGTFTVNSTSPGQIVYNLHRTALENNGSSTYNISYIGWSNLQSYSATLSNKTFVNDSTHVKNGNECVNYLVHYCGDGVVDTQASIAALPGGIPNSIANEQCDGTAGTPAGYTCNSSCQLVHTIVQPTCSLTPNQTINCGQNAVLNFNSTNTNSISNLQNIGAGIILPNQAGFFNVSPTQTTTYKFTANGMPGSTPATCSATVTVNANPQPTCLLTPANQTITAGQNALLNFNSTYTTSVSNLQNIAGGIISPNQAGFFNVSPTQTTTYSFTVNGGACTTPVTCSATVTVLSAPKPNLRIDKKLINNIPYQSGDLVGWKIEFGNNGSGIAHNVILTDYLPISLGYVSSQLFGIASYHFGVTNIGANPGVIFSGFDLAPGQTGYFIITGRLLGYDHCNATVNNAFIESTEIQPPLYDADYFMCYVPTNTVLTIDKSINKSLFYPNEYIYFTIAVTNHGPAIADTVKIGDIRWPNTACIIPLSPRSSSMPMTLTAPNNPYERTLNVPLQVGQTVYLYLTGQVANTRACAGHYINTGTLTYVFGGQTFTGWDYVPFDVPGPTTGTAQCSDLVAHGGNIVIVDEDDYEGDANFSCYTQSGLAQTMTIDCGNGQSFTTHNVSSMNATCHFDETSIPADRYVNCTVDGHTQNSCQQHMIIDKKSFGVCGDGDLDEYEDCDLGDNDEEIHDYLDADHDVDAGKYANKGYTCHNCDIRKHGEDIPMAACFSLNENNVSVQEDEILPFRWRVDTMENDLSDEDDCIPGDINEDSMKCEFRIFNGEKPESGVGSHFGDYDAPTVKTFTIPCNKDTWTDDGDFGVPKKLFQYVYNQRANIRSLQDPFGRYYIDMDTVDLDDVYGEYNLALYQVRYEYCNADREWVDGTPIDRVCESDFTVTKPYLAQKSSFGLTPKTTTINLDGFLDIFGNSIIKKTDLDKIMVIDANTYKGGTNVNNMMTTFINKYNKLAVSVPKNKVPALNQAGITSIKIVPQQKIYIIEGTAGTTLRLNSAFDASTPFTIVTKNINLIVEGDLKTNGMFLVSNGTITFQEPDTNRCAHTQTVQGIFITNKGFAADTEGLANDSVNKTRCAYGGLHVKGVLIGNSIDKLVQSRRSQLNHWFYAGSSMDPSVLAERRNEIFKGAAVLIEYSPSLRSALPPGADEFTKALDVYKK